MNASIAFATPVSSNAWIVRVRRMSENPPFPPPSVPFASPFGAMAPSSLSEVWTSPVRFKQEGCAATRDRSQTRAFGHRCGGHRFGPGLGRSGLVVSCEVKFHVVSSSLVSRFAADRFLGHSCKSFFKPTHEEKLLIVPLLSWYHSATRRKSSTSLFFRACDVGVG